jgi:hypothetical protein
LEGYTMFDTHDTIRTTAPDTDEEPTSPEEQRAQAAAGTQAAHDEALTIRSTVEGFRISMWLPEATSTKDDAAQTGEYEWAWPVGVEELGGYHRVAVLALDVQAMDLGTVPAWLPGGIAIQLTSALYVEADAARVRLEEHRQAARSAEHVDEAWQAIDRCGEMAEVLRGAETLPVAS